MPRSVYQTDWTKPETREALGDAASLVANFTPVIGDVKGAADAVREPTARNILAAAVGLVPIVGDVASKGIKNADNLIAAAGKLERVSGGARQGRVEGDADSLFSTITEGGTLRQSGYVEMPDGTIIGTHASKSTGVSTIDINKNGLLYKIRVHPPKSGGE